MRLFRLLPLMLFLLLCGCQGGDSAAGSLPDLDKAQEVRVIPAGETAPTQVLTEKSQIEALILAMDLDHWSTADLPQGLRPAGTPVSYTHLSSSVLALMDMITSVPTVSFWQGSMV